MLFPNMSIARSGLAHPRYIGAQSTISEPPKKPLNRLHYTTHERIPHSLVPKMEFMKLTELEIPAAFDAHVHLRDGEMSELVTPTIRMGGVDQVYVMVSISKTKHTSLIQFPKTSLVQINSSLYKRSIHQFCPSLFHILWILFEKDLSLHSYLSNMYSCFSSQISSRQSRQ